MLDVSIIDQFHFLRPWWFLAIAPWLLALHYFRRLEDGRERWKGIIAPHLVDRLVVKSSEQRTITPRRTLLVLGVAVILAMAGPSWRTQPSPYLEDKAPLVLALDLSSSMEYDDVEPSRFERAKQKISDLLAERGGSPTALIVFAGTAHSVMPLTDDPDVLRNLLAAVNPGIMPAKGKRPDRILPEAEHMLNAGGAPGSLVLLSDGIDEGAIGAFRSFFAGAGSQLQLLVWGIGLTEPVAADSMEAKPLDEAGLQELARVCGGAYQPLTLDATDAARIQRLTKSHLVAAQEEYNPPVDDGYYLCIPIAILAAFWFRRGWTLSWT